MKEEKFNKAGESIKIAQWLDSFKKKHARPPRILHIGNIANNAYINAKILIDAGLGCEVLCYEYYHIMGCPEWEESDYEGEINDLLFPDWKAVNLKGFKRPDWFIQGSLQLSIEYLTAKYSGNVKKEFFYKRLLSFLNNTASRKEAKIRYRELQAMFLLRIEGFYHRLWRFVYGKDVKDWLEHKPKCFYKDFSILSNIIKKFVYLALKSTVLIIKFVLLPLVISYRGRSRFDYLRKTFNAAFPNRPDNLACNDLVIHQSTVNLWNKAFQYYDLVHVYSTDGIFPLLAGKPYVAYEHGTLRNIPFNQTTQGRLCALTYKFADRVCITNADNIAAVKKLGIENYTFVPHPINEEFLVYDEKERTLFASLRKALDSDFVVFHPSRQHWEEQRHPDWEKGNDIFIKGFARFVNKVNPRAGAVFVEWGKSVADSKRLLEALGIADRVIWIEPQPNRKMIRYIYATDLLADQFYLGAFGSTMPKALACGKPAMIYLDNNIHEWCFEELPPVINAKTPEEVYVGLAKVYTDKEWAAQLADKGRSWYSKYHSNKIILEKLLTVYKEVLSSNGK